MKEFEVRETRFPMRLAAEIFGILLLMSGIHTGIVEFYTVSNLNVIVKILSPIIYWGVISLGITVFIRKMMRKTYEEPLKILAKATDAVAHGDFSVYVTPLHTPDKLDYMDIMIMDFNKMVEELGSIETLKTDFFSNVSHEIKTPLSVISNEAQLLMLQKELSQNQREQVEQILSASRRLSNLITNILKLNRLEKQKIQPEICHYNLCQQICDCVLQFENRWEEKQIELEVEMEDKVLIEADQNLMEIVWNNLMSNALKFTENGGTVKIQEISTDSEVVVKIIDSGCGMTQETMNHIFDKFYQGDTSHATEGNGLGLVLVLRVIQLSGGEISVDSEKGKGTTFIVQIPKRKGMG